MAKHARKDVRIDRRIDLGVLILLFIATIVVAVDWQQMQSRHAALLLHDPYADVHYVNAYELMIWDESEALAQTRERLGGPLPLDRMYSAYLDGPWLNDANAGEVAAILEDMACEEECHLVLIDTALTDQGFEAMQELRHLTGLVIRNEDGQRKRPNGPHGWTILGYQPPEPASLSGEWLKEYPRLREILIENPSVGDEIIPEIVSRPQLRSVILQKCQLTDAGLLELASKPALDYVSLRETQVTREGAWAFRTARPDVEFVGSMTPPDDVTAVELQNYRRARDAAKNAKQNS